MSALLGLLGFLGCFLSTPTYFFFLFFSREGERKTQETQQPPCESGVHGSSLAINAKGHARPVGFLGDGFSRYVNKQTADG
jgi:hypothetical protein